MSLPSRSFLFFFIYFSDQDFLVRRLRIWEMSSVVTRLIPLIMRLFFYDFYLLLLHGCHSFSLSLSLLYDSHLLLFFLLALCLQTCYILHSQ